MNIFTYTLQRMTRETELQATTNYRRLIHSAEETACGPYLGQVG